LQLLSEAGTIVADMTSVPRASPLAVILVLTACGPTYSGRRARELDQGETVQIRHRAGFDLQCPDEQTTLIELDALSYGARGCGRQLRYMKNCARCQWTPAGAVTQIVADDAGADAQ
jgi:hypothetical protein